MYFQDPKNIIIWTIIFIQRSHLCNDDHTKTKAVISGYNIIDITHRNTYGIITYSSHDIDNVTLIGSQIGTTTSIRAVRKNNCRQHL